MHSCLILQAKPGPTPEPLCLHFLFEKLSSLELQTLHLRLLHTLSSFTKDNLEKLYINIYMCVYVYTHIYNCFFTKQGLLEDHVCSLLQSLALDMTQWQVVTAVGFRSDRFPPFRCVGDRPIMPCVHLTPGTCTPVIHSQTALQALGDREERSEGTFLPCTFLHRFLLILSL